MRFGLESLKQKGVQNDRAEQRQSCQVKGEDGGK